MGAPAGDLPAGGSPYRIAVVCLGNICRSPMAEVVLTRKVEEAGLAGRVAVSSAGTGDWHVGEPIDPRAGATLRGAGYDPSRHRAQQFGAGWLDHDLVLAMDATNLADVRVLADTTHDRDDGRVRMFRDFDPDGPGDVPDPWYGDAAGFDEVLAIVERTADALVVALRRALR
ncbi:MAG TPA: low molecular weight protein-tyrosine-phosphatase [Marmoricola sp.]|nr:low molecular weight protein-tyrosine-phosphatase [Marmoricola sp.]